MLHFPKLIICMLFVKWLFKSFAQFLWDCCLTIWRVLVIFVWKYFNQNVMNYFIISLAYLSTLLMTCSNTFLFWWCPVHLFFFFSFSSLIPTLFYFLSSLNYVISLPIITKLSSRFSIYWWGLVYIFVCYNNWFSDNLLFYLL